MRQQDVDMDGRPRTANARSSSAYANNLNPTYNGQQAVAERLYKDATDRLERNFFAQADESKIYVDNRNGGGPNHRPSMSQTSKQLSQSNQMFHGNLKNFHDR